MRPQSCLLQHTGVSSYTAAVRNDRTHLPVTLLISYKAPRLGLPVPGLHNMTMSMRKGECVGQYTLYTAHWTIPGGMSFASKIDIISGEMGGEDTVADDFNDAAELPGSCAPFRGPATCVSVVVTTTTASSTASTATTISSMVLATAVATPAALPEPVHGMSSDGAGEAFRMGHAFASFFQYLTNYIVNFFFGSVSQLPIGL